MARKLSAIALAAFLSIVPTVVGAMGWSAPETAFSQESNTVVSYAGGVLSVSGADNQVLTIVSLTGKVVMEVRIDSPAQKIELNISKGCYIVKVGDIVRKISVR